MDLRLLRSAAALGGAGLAADQEVFAAAQHTSRWQQRRRCYC
jgi:hypothetical protein